MNTVLNDIITALSLLSTEKRRDFGKRTYPSKMNILGVTVPDIRKVLVELKSISSKWTTVDKINFAFKMIESGCFECHQLALEWVGHDKMLMKDIGTVEAKRLRQGMDNWVSVDTYAILILGPLWQSGVVSDDSVLKLVQSQDIWTRRIAVASTVALNRKKKGYSGDSKRTLAICDLVVNDHHDMIVKALSWALRSLVNWDRNGVELFIEKHNSVLHKRVIREVGNKLKTGYKY
jgi:3-methyladenine DNA glycosylase AlkD